MLERCVVSASSVAQASANMVFTLGLRHTFQLCQRGLALVQFPVVQTSLASFRAGVVKTFRWPNLAVRCGVHLGMNLETESYLTQTSTWPETGRVILANFDDDSIVVYQAYRPEIGNFAAKNGYLGGDFKLTRMSWIKPNFLWMMYRCGWASKQGQEVVLAIRIRRSAFDSILSQAIHSSYKPDLYDSRDAWKQRVSNSDVRLQWDPDHAPNGDKMERRAVQLGLRGDTLRQYARDWIVDITDVSDFVRNQRDNSDNSRYDQLQMPRERVYPVTCTETAQKLRLDHVS